jgi:hypothetical protein
VRVGQPAGVIAVSLPFACRIFKALP